MNDERLRIDECQFDGYNIEISMFRSKIIMDGMMVGFFEWGSIEN